MIPLAPAHDGPGLAGWKFNPILPTSSCALYHTPLLTAAVYISGKPLRNLLLTFSLPTRIGSLNFVLQADGSWDSQSRLKSSRACHEGSVYASAGQLIGLLSDSILILSGSRSTIQETKTLDDYTSVRKLEERAFGVG